MKRRTTLGAVVVNATDSSLTSGAIGVTVHENTVANFDDITVS